MIYSKSGSRLSFLFFFGVQRDVTGARSHLLDAELPELTRRRKRKGHAVNSIEVRGCGRGSYLLTSFICSLPIGSPSRTPALAQSLRVGAGL